MAFSGGVFSLISGNPVSSGTIISSTWANDTLNDIANNGLSECLLKDGSQIATARIPFAAGISTFGVNLDGNSGSSEVGFIASGTGASGRTVQAKLRDAISVKDFGAVGDGTTDDTTAIQNAVTAGASNTVYFPPGTYKLSSAITVPASTRLLGAGVGATSIQQSTNNVAIFTISSSYCSASDMTLGYSVVAISGANAIDVSAYGFSYQNLRINDSYNGMRFTSCSGSRGSKLDINNYINIGWFINGGSNDHYLCDFIFNAGNATNGALGGIRLVDRAEAIVVANGDILAGVSPLTTAASSYALSTRPAYCNFSNVFFDSGVQGATINQIVETEFVGCWFSNGRSGGGNAGAVIGATASNSLKFISCRFFYCGSHGAVLSVNAVSTIFSGCSFQNNSVTTGVGVAHGLSVAANTNDFVVTDCIANNALQTSSQGYGILVNAGTSDRYVIQNNLVTGNATGGVSDGGTGINKNVANNY